MGNALHLGVGNRYSVVTMIVRRIFPARCVDVVCADDQSVLRELRPRRNTVYRCHEEAWSVCHGTVCLSVSLAPEATLCDSKLTMDQSSMFGVVTIAQGFIHNWGSLIALRLLLGAFEGALLPGTLFCKVPIEIEVLMYVLTWTQSASGLVHSVGVRQTVCDIVHWSMAAANTVQTGSILPCRHRIEWPFWSVGVWN